MSGSALDLSPLAKAISRLEESLRFCGSDMARGDPALAEQFRAAAIQAFEFTYELSHKMLKRFLKASLADPAAVEEMSFQDLIRTGSERGLVRSGWSSWRDYRAARGATSHAYDEGKAAEVFALLPLFLDEAKELLRRLEEALKGI